MELKEIYELVKETMQNWEPDDLYSHCVCVIYKDRQAGKFFVHIEPVGNVFYVNTDIGLTKELHYETEEYLDTEELVQYLKKLDKLDKLDVKVLNDAKEEMNKALEKCFKNTFLGHKEEN